ncbi:MULTISPECIES: family 16 glycosylhydrolase [Haloferax]|uniref:glycoside hydrolase family 16 protein n=1 Tax=Haloferax TaxID=2251 RepID=UPI0017818278|nr:MULTISPECIES: glycoside hydrolase family 16 protein [Haloferax]
MDHSDVGPQYGAVDTSQMTLAFEDTFEDDSLDESLWGTEYPWKSRVHNYNGYADPNNVYISMDTLVIKAEKKPQNGKTYTTGVASPRRDFSYGFFEASVKVPPIATGFWPAFWMTPVDAWPPEIDIFEFFGDDPRAHMTYHYNDLLGLKKKANGAAAVPNPSSNFHTYAVDWAPEKIVWYIDGQEQFRFTGPRVTQDEMHLIFNFGIDASFLGTPRDEDLPEVMQIDYLRVWQR